MLFKGQSTRIVLKDVKFRLFKKKSMTLYQNKKI